MAKTKSAAKKAQDLDRYLLLKEEYINNSELTDLSGEIADAILNLPVRVFMTDATHAAKQRGANHYFLMDVHAVERKARIYRSKLGSNLKTIAEFYRNTARTAELLHRAAQMVVDNYDESGEIFDPTVSNLLGFINSMIHNYEMTSDKVVTDEWGVPSLNDAGHFEAVRLNSLAQNYVMNLKNLVEYNATLVMEEAIDKIAPTPEIAEYTKAHFYIYVK